MEPADLSRQTGPPGMFSGMLPRVVYFHVADPAADMFTNELSGDSRFERDLENLWSWDNNGLFMFIV